MATRNKILVGFVVLGFLNLLSWSALFWTVSSPPLKVVFFDVGQGDAIFIQIASLYQILIDGGPDSSILERLSREMPFWDRTIDLVVLTHPEKDHMTGLTNVLERYHVDYVVWTGVIRDTLAFQRWQDALKQEIKEGCDIKIAKKGQRIIVGKAILDILHPFKELKDTSPNDSNKTSVVAKLLFGEISFLFTGDIYSSQERDLITSGVDLDSDVLKLAHHGSKTSSSDEFISAVSPEIAVAQIGKDNSYGHPHQQIIQRLTQRYIVLFRTDINGDITMTSDGNCLKVEGFEI